MKAKITVRLKSAVLDPQGKAVLHAAQSLGFKEIADVRVGKVFDIELIADTKAEIHSALEKLADQLLANTVIENFEVELAK
jgi:phosphoribosylformylglycinamidine synthase